MIPCGRLEPAPALVGGEERDEEPRPGGHDQRHHYLGGGERMQLGQGDPQRQAAHAAGYGLQPEPATVRADAIVADRIADRVVTGGEQVQHDQGDRLDRGGQSRDNAGGFHHGILPGLARPPGSALLLTLMGVPPLPGPGRS